MNVTETKNSPTDSLNNLRNFLQRFYIIPYICTRGKFTSPSDWTWHKSLDQTSLLVDLSPHGSQILGGSSLILWVPVSWLTPASHFKRRKKLLEKSSNLVGELGEYFSDICWIIIFKIFLGWLGVNVTRLAKSSLRKGRTHLEIVNLSAKYYIQTAFLEVTKQDTDKVGLSGHLDITLSLFQCQENVERKKRSQDGTCSLQQISVNLTHIGWDFVISPSMLEFRYCSGACSVTDIPARMFIKQHGQIRYVSWSQSTWTSPPLLSSE